MINLEEIRDKQVTNPLSKKHIHQYHSGRLGKHKIWKCKLPGCTHYLMNSFMPNKLCLCNVCGDPFLITKRSLRNEHPRCDKCVRHKAVNPETVAAIGKLLGDDDGSNGTT